MLITAVIVGFIAWSLIGWIVVHCLWDCNAFQSKEGEMPDFLRMSKFCLACGPAGWCLFGLFLIGLLMEKLDPEKVTAWLYKAEETKTKE